MPNPWDNAPVYQPQPQAQPQSRPQAQPRVRPVFTAPPKAPDPVEQQRLANEQERLRMAQEDQRRQNENARRDAEKAQRDAIEFQNKQEQRSLTGGVDASVEQGKAASFYKRALGANRDYDKGGLDPDSMIGRFGSATFPQITANMSSDARNAQRSREREFIGAILRYDSGAAIPDSEYDNAYQTYFPSSSAGPEEIQQKAIARQRAVEGLKIGAGPAASLADTQDDPNADNQQPLAPLGKGIIPSENPDDYKREFPNAKRVVYDEKGQAVGHIDQDGNYVETLIEVDVPGVGVDEMTPAEVEALKAERNTFGGAADSLIRGAADAVTLGFADEIAAGLSTAFNGGTYQQNLYDERQIDRVDRDVNPIASGVGMVGGALMLPSGIGNAMRSGGLRAGAVQGAREGAAYGGAYGFGSGENMQDRSMNALAGAGLGAAVGAAAPFAVNALAKIGGRGNPQGNALVSDARSLGVDLMPADVGGATVKRFSAGAAQNPASAERMYKGFEQTQEQMGAALGQTARKNASPLPIDDAGELVRGGAKRFSENTSARGGRLYEQAISAAKGVKIKPQGAIAEIDKNIAELAQSGEVAKPLIKELQSFRKSLAQQGGLTVEGLRGVRTALRDEIAKQGLRGSNTDRIFNNVLEMAAQDMEAGLRAVGRDGAANAFQRADAFWKQRVETIDEVLDPLIGKNAPKSGEAILTEIERMAQGKGRGVANLSRVMAELSPKEAEGVRATVIERLGLATAGNQGAQGGKFSASSFLTNWNKMSPKGKAILFKPEHRADLDKIARLAEATKDTQRFANTSGTAGATLSQPSVGGIIMYIPQNATGRLLSSQAFTSWLARAPRSTAGQKAHIAQLSKLSTRVPALSADIKGLQQSLVEAFQPAQLAAEPEPKR